MYRLTRLFSALDMLPDDGWVRLSLLFIYLAFVQDTLHGCRTPQLQQAPVGYTCRGSSNVIYNTSEIAYPQCLWHCLRRNNCMILMYNTEHGFCLLANDSCFQAVYDANATVTYLGPQRNDSINWWNQTSHDNRSSVLIPSHNESINVPNQTNNDTIIHDCTEWKINADDMPSDLVVVNDGVNDYAVARISVGNALLPGTYRNGNTKTALDGVRQSDLAGEYLLVPPGCSVQWVPWGTTSGSELPVGTKTGGHLANDVPLYVAKGLVESDKMKIGYYNPETSRGHFWFNAEITLTEIFVLVVNWKKIRGIILAPL